MGFTLPLWGILGLAVAFISTFVPLIQERYKAEPFPLVMWMKIVVAIITLPFLLLHETIPTNAKFFISTFLSACVWAVSDIFYFNAIRHVGSGVVTRVIPSAVIITFIVWTMIDAQFRANYFSDPIQAVTIAATILMSVFFAFRLSKCPVSWQGIRLLWFVLFAVAIGPILDKLSIGSSNVKSDG
jgi:glucose uptake protein GlcU